MNKDVIMIIVKIAWYRSIRYQNENYMNCYKYQEGYGSLMTSNRAFVFNYRRCLGRYNAIWNVKTRNIIAELPNNYK